MTSRWSAQPFHQRSGETEGLVDGDEIAAEFRGERRIGEPPGMHLETLPQSRIAPQRFRHAQSGERDDMGQGDLGEGEGGRASAC